MLFFIISDFKWQFVSFEIDFVYIKLGLFTLWYQISLHRSHPNIGDKAAANEVIDHE